jgi:hypothetical protein
MSNIKKALPNTKIVQIGEEQIEIKKLPLGKYAELMLALQNVPSSIMSDLQGLDTNDEDKMLQTMFGIFGKAWGQILEILAIGSGLDKDRIENDPDIGLDGGIELFLAIYEVNNLDKVIKQVKNVINRSANR